MKKINTKTEKRLHYVYILDESGSMMGLWDQTLESVNAQIELVKQQTKKLGIKAFLTLVTFDSTLGRSPVRFLFEQKPFEAVQKVTKENYCPNGGTPLRDAVGLTVERVQKFLGNTIADSNLNILVNIFTDGQENSSQTFSHDQIQKMIKHLQKDDKWTFAFMGAGGIQEVQAYAGSIGISKANTMAFANDSGGHTRCYNALSVGTTSYLDDYSRGIKSKGVFAEQKS